MEKRFKVARVIGLFYIGTLVAYALLIFLIRLPAAAPPPRPVEPVLRIAVWIFGLAAFAAGLALADRFVPRPAEVNDDTIGQMLMTRMIIRLACFDAAAIGGLLVFFLTHDWTDFALLASLAFALKLGHQPSRAQWLNESRAAGLSWQL
jgi:hypothetical protein